ncbi:class I glutamine amidotransferase-like protein [Aspergillus granulosus]|uniref:Class I glutamine amidotransferase-like protein n=1 Tax=Aspergillus granulosus TaxID=176169 RepID=A0ABR4H7Y9_9EURO
MAPIDLRNPGRPIRVGVILLNSTTELIDIAPFGFFSSISRSFLKDFPSSVCPDEIKAQVPEFTYHWVTETGDTPAKLTAGMNVVPTDSFASCPDLDIALLGAGHISHEPSEAESAYIRKVHESCTALLTVCGGFVPVLCAGLLEGKTATAPRLFLPMFKEKAPGVNWVDKRYVNDGKIWTTGVLLNGMDMIAAFGRSVWGETVDKLITDGSWPERDVEYRDDDGKL